jgi:hypothetical protein
MSLLKGRHRSGGRHVSRGPVAPLQGFADWRRSWVPRALPWADMWLPLRGGGRTAQLQKAQSRLGNGGMSPLENRRRGLIDRPRPSGRWSRPRRLTAERTRDRHRSIFAGFVCRSWRKVGRSTLSLLGVSSLCFGGKRKNPRHSNSQCICSRIDVWPGQSLRAPAVRRLSKNRGTRTLPRPHLKPPGACFRFVPAIVTDRDLRDYSLVGVAGASTTAHSPCSEPTPCAQR